MGVAVLFDAGGILSQRLHSDTQCLLSCIALQLKRRSPISKIPVPLGESEKYLHSTLKFGNSCIEFVRYTESGCRSRFPRTISGVG